MSLQNLKVDELKELAAFYAVEPKVADEDHGPTKKELLAALAEEDVSKDDYETFVEAKKSGADKTLEEKREEAAAALAAAAEAKAEEEEKVEDKTAESTEDEQVAGTEETKEEVEADAAEALEVAEEQDEDEGAEDEVLVKMERKNGTYEVAGYTFSKLHPFKSVPASVAERLVRDETGFRLALPSEVKDYYN